MQIYEKRVKIAIGKREGAKLSGMLFVKGEDKDAKLKLRHRTGIIIRGIIKG